ncbi:MAG: 2-C-methyl-D-erythritol 4-phosphate cytidylyltransferase [Epulopiscium sp. Nuni2H_MBin003]|nr:MAG: 2-C-methyl-D-erythritol 4-phosphate cytidylyltransferase [Epulopiscium sp. Nuni2H_MBin003]
MEDNMNCAIIVAGGKGRRLDGNTKKQYLKLDSKYVLTHTIEKFQSSNMVHEIIVVCPEEDIDFVREEICNTFNKVKSVIAGGAERQDSVYNALKILGEHITKVLIHDGVRPFITEEEIKRCICKDVSACILGVPVKDTIKKCVEGKIIETIDRATVFSIQTPQVFNKDVIIRAHQNAIEYGWQSTDDSALVEKLGEVVYIELGSYENIKLTTPSDMDLAKFILAKRKEK